MAQHLSHIAQKQNPHFRKGLLHLKCKLKCKKMKEIKIERDKKDVKKSPNQLTLQEAKKFQKELVDKAVRDIKKGIKKGINIKLK